MLFLPFPRRNSRFAQWEGIEGPKDGVKSKRASREGSEAVSEREVKRARSESESGKGAEGGDGRESGEDENEGEGRVDVKDVEMDAS